MSNSLEIHKIIKAHMIFNDFNIIKLSRVTGIPASTLSRKLKGETEFTLSEAKKIADALNISDPWDIFFNTKKPNMQ